MNRQIIFLVAVILSAAVGAGIIVMLRPEPQPAPAATTVEATPTVVPPPAPAAAPVETARPTRRPPLPPPAAPAPAAAISASPDVVTLRIDSDVPGAQVFIDRQFIGAAPVTTTDVTPGSHQVNVSAPGFDGYAQSIDVTPGSRDIMVRFKEVKLAARVDVVHKHRIGSCRGTLIATPQGLRYDTTDKDDAFMVPLEHLDTFAVDYLEKNLKVKIKNGKQYNFTDSAGNADALFVFQRDVDKARQRLLKGDQPATD